MLHSSAAPLAALALLSGFVGCKSSTERASFSAEAAHIRKEATAAGARTSYVSDAVREPHRAWQQWTIEIHDEWTPFSLKLRAALSRSYRCATDGDTLRCARSTPGDRFRLSFSPSAPRQVTVRLEAQPD